MWSTRASSKKTKPNNRILPASALHSTISHRQLGFTALFFTKPKVWSVQFRPCCRCCSCSTWLAPERPTDRLALAFDVNVNKTCVYMYSRRQSEFNLIRTWWSQSRRVAYVTNIAGGYCVGFIPGLSVVGGWCDGLNSTQWCWWLMRKPLVFVTGY